MLSRNIYEYQGSSARKTPAQVFGFSKEAMTEVKWRRKYECETQIGESYLHKIYGFIYDIYT